MDLIFLGGNPLFMIKLLRVSILVTGAFFLAALLHAAHAQSLSTYVVKSGDTLSSIAASELGNASLWQSLYAANESHIANPNIIYPGEILVLPSTSASNTVVTASVQTGFISNKDKYEGVISAAAAKYNVDAVLMNKIIACESGYNPNAYNPSGATGIAQFMPGTYYGSWNPYRFSYSIYSPIGQIYAMALKISLGGVNAWVCYHKVTSM